MSDRRPGRLLLIDQVTIQILVVPVLGEVKAQVVAEELLTRDEFDLAIVPVIFFNAVLLAVLECHHDVGLQLFLVHIFVELFVDDHVYLAAIGQVIGQLFEFTQENWSGVLRVNNCWPLFIVNDLIILTLSHVILHKLKSVANLKRHFKEDGLKVGQ